MPRSRATATNRSASRSVTAARLASSAAARVLPVEDRPAPAVALDEVEVGQDPAPHPDVGAADGRDLRDGLAEVVAGPADDRPVEALLRPEVRVDERLRDAGQRRHRVHRSAVEATLGELALGHVEDLALAYGARD